MSLVSRRTIAVAIALVAAGGLGRPRLAPAQGPARIPQLGYVALGSRGAHPPSEDIVAALRAGLRDLGYEEDRTIRIAYRFADGRVERLSGLVAELVRLKVDVLLTPGTITTQVARQITRTVPIVSTTGDPVEAGLAASLARPGSNVTGLALNADDIGLAPKWLELLKEAVPGLARAAYLMNPTRPRSVPRDPGLLATARELGVRLIPAAVRSPADLDRVLEDVLAARPDGLLSDGDPLTDGEFRRIAEFAVRHRLPGVFPRRRFVEAGGLVSYGPSLTHAWRRVATYVDKILKGASPAELPIEQPTKFNLVVNARAARVLGLPIPQSLLLRADEVIQ